MHKKGALELSVGTIVVLVLGVTMLILGFVLVQNIFSGATESVDLINEKVQNEIGALFSDETSDLVVKLGSSNTAKIKAGSGVFGVAIGARTSDGSTTTRDRLTYTLELDEASTNNCYRVLGQARTEALFRTPLNAPNQFDRIDGPNSFAIIEVEIPEGTAQCTQKVFIDVKDTQNPAFNAGSFFIIDIQKAGLF